MVQMTMTDPDIETIIEEEEVDEAEEEESYKAFLYDQYEDEDFSDYVLERDPEERIINWDGDEYEYYDDSIEQEKYYEA
jgi:hypothetical protein